MKKLFILLFALVLPITALAKTVNISFYSDDPNLDAVATLSYRLCIANDCTISEMKHLNFYAMTGENKAQVMIQDNEYLIGYRLTVNHKKPLYINTPMNLDQPCKAVKDQDTLIIQPATDGIYACNGELSQL